MLTLVLGHSGSGKSMLAERELALTGSLAPKYYLATLPPLRVYEKRIMRHRIRRPPEWAVFELSGDLDFDSELLSACKRGSVLLDGSSIYAERVLEEPILNPGCWARRILEWVDWVILSKHDNVIIVDSYTCGQGLKPSEIVIGQVQAGLRALASYTYHLGKT